MVVPVGERVGSAATLRPGGRGWSILIIAALTATLTGPGQTIGVSVFIDHFVEDLGLSRPSVAGAYLIGTLTGALAMPAVGRFVDRRGVRRAQVVVGVAFAVALANMAAVDGLPWLVVGFVGIRLLGQGALSMISTLTVSLRFVANRGFALGLFATLAAGGMALVPLALDAVIVRSGWRQAWLVAAAVVMAIVVPAGWFGLRRLPRPGSAAVDPSLPIDSESWTRAAALRTRSFWILASVWAAAGMLTTALNFHQIDLLGDAGLSSREAAAMFLPQVLGSTVAGLGVGLARDRIGTRFLPAAGAALLALALMLATVVSPGLTVVAYAVVLGAAGGTIHTAGATLLADWFGTAHLGSIQGVATFVNVGASATGPVLLALALSWSGSYPPAILGFIVIPLVIFVFALGSETDLRAQSVPA